MVEFDPKRARSVPFEHQKIGTVALLSHRAYALFDEMGLGKSKQVIDAASALADAAQLDLVVVLAPASVRSVWLDPDDGEIRKHAWVPSRVLEFHAPRKKGGSRWREVWADAPSEGASTRLTWVVTNYEFIRAEANRSWLLKGIGTKTKNMLILDESSYVKNHAAQQTKAAYAVRRLASRCVLLNGTPVTNSPLDLWAQLAILDERILGERFKNFYHFKYHFCRLGGWHDKQILGYQNLEELQRLVAPYALRREKKDALDLPPKLYTSREVPLAAGTWTRYRELKREALLALPNRETVLEPNAAVRLVRLAQLTSGIISTVGEQATSDPDQMLFPTENGFEASTRWLDLSSEKLDWALNYLREETTANAVIIWCRFRRERERLVAELRATRSSTWSVVELYGGQSRGDRETAVSTMALGDRKAKRVVLVGQPHAGGLGLNLTRATEVVYLSNDYSLAGRLQSEDRCHRIGQEHPVTYVDVLATGPKGERTIDHVVRKALAKKQDLAAWTSSAWRRALEEDE